MTQHNDAVPENTSGLILAHKAHVRAIEDELCVAASDAALAAWERGAEAYLKLGNALRNERAARVAAEAVRVGGGVGCE